MQPFKEEATRWLAGNAGGSRWNFLQCYLLLHRPIPPAEPLPDAADGVPKPSPATVLRGARDTAWHSFGGEAEVSSGLWVCSCAPWGCCEVVLELEKKRSAKAMLNLSEAYMSVVGLKVH